MAPEGPGEHMSTLRRPRSQPVSAVSDRFANYLLEGETVLWTGRPGVGLLSEDGAADATARYAVTDRRVLALGAARGGTLAEAAIAPQLAVRYALRPDGNGTLHFGDPASPRVTFSDIAHAAWVRDLVLGLRDPPRVYTLGSKEG